MWISLLTYSDIALLTLIELDSRFDKVQLSVKIFVSVFILIPLTSFTCLSFLAGIIILGHIINS